MTLNQRLMLLLSLLMKLNLQLATTLNLLMKLNLQLKLSLVAGASESAFEALTSTHLPFE